MIGWLQDDGTACRRPRGGIWLDRRVGLQGEELQGAWYGFVLVSRFEGLGLDGGPVAGVEQQGPVFATDRVGNSERDRLMEAVEDDEQRGVGAAAPKAGGLGSAVDQHAEAAIGFPIFFAHFLAGGVDPGDVLDPQLFIVNAGEKPIAAKDRILVANFG